MSESAHHVTSRFEQLRRRRPWRLSLSNRRMIWDAMLAVLPRVLAEHPDMPPAGVAHLCREHAEALMHEYLVAQRVDTTPP
jgi:hypothetical protein